MSSAFDQTPLRPDAPAMPMHSHDANDWNTPVPYVPGLTARQHAAIALCVPDSGCDWLDAMIERRRRDEFAAKAMQGMLGSDIACGPDDVSHVAASAYIIADAMLAASK